ncbi:MAG: ferrous iron transport protein B [Prevotella sp.]|jgi:ferrous iron transport protein B|nr:ferrous iron transport protein B [Prevotella sp.]MCH3993833.1 ferrous iron transport protein B [Prevotella sp.]
MKLSELKTGEEAVIVKVSGHGGFRKRIIEMGFIKGKTVKALLNAPLKDPVKYQVMGYEVSLRHSEAALIEVVSLEEAKEIEAKKEKLSGPQEEQTLRTVADASDPDDRPFVSKAWKEVANEKHRIINVALVGNPNCGKTTLFNFASGAHERVGNYAGVTVDAKEGHAKFEGYEFNLVDLPGTYSLSAYSPEERYVRKQLIDKTPDVVINVVDAFNLERNLYLTTELIDMHIRMVVALNFFDEANQRGDTVDRDKLSELFGVPMLPTVFKSGKGVKELFHEIIQVYESEEGSDPHYRHIHINHGHEIENGIKEIQEHLKKETDIRQSYSTRYLAIKLLQMDKDVEAIVSKLPDAKEIFAHRDTAAKRVKEETGEDSETAIMDAKYGFIHGALEEAQFHTGKKKNSYQLTHQMDKILTNKWIGFPIFFIILFVIFTATFILGSYPQDWIQDGIDALGSVVSTTMPAGPIKAMIVDGIIGGVGAVIVFIPQILILYFFISFMEDSGYMARAAFIMDKLMHKMGLHGKSFIPLIMGFGCNVPAVMATRTIESKRSRLITMLIIPMMSCTARIPIYIMICGIFFPLKYRGLILTSFYLIGILMAVLMSLLFGKLFFKKEDTPFVMELPPYRFPTWKAIGRHTWEKGKQYLKKMGGVILAGSIIIWALGYFPHPEHLTAQQQQEQSYLGRIGRTIEPVFRPQGFNWKLDVGLLAGAAAKEIVASSLGVIYANQEEVDDGSKGSEKIHRQMIRDIAQSDGITLSQAEPIGGLTAYCYLLFVLLYIPCIATIAAIKGETGSWKWAGFAAGYTYVLAWVVSAVVFQVGKLFIL